MLYRLYRVGKSDLHQIWIEIGESFLLPTRLFDFRLSCTVSKPKCLKVECGRILRPNFALFTHIKFMGGVKEMSESGFQVQTWPNFRYTFGAGLLRRLQDCIHSGSPFFSGGNFVLVFSQGATNHKFGNEIGPCRRSQCNLSLIHI